MNTILDRKVDENYAMNPQRIGARFRASNPNPSTPNLRSLIEDVPQGARFLWGRIPVVLGTLWGVRKNHGTPENLGHR